MKKIIATVALVLFAICGTLNVQEPGLAVQLEKKKVIVDRIKDKKFDAEIVVDSNVKIQQEVTAKVRFKPVLSFDIIEFQVSATPGVQIRGGQTSVSIKNAEAGKVYEFPYKIVFDSEGIKEVKVTVTGSIDGKNLKEIENVIVYAPCGFKKAAGVFENH